jgi:hypothetical protein
MKNNKLYIILPVAGLAVIATGVLAFILIKNDNPIKTTINSVLTQKDDDSTDQEKQEAETSDDAETKSQNQTADYDISGTYTFEEKTTENPTATLTETNNLSISLTVKETGDIKGNYSEIFHSESSTAGTVDTEDVYKFTGKVGDNNTFEKQLTYTATTDNDQVQPYHREFEREILITIEFKEDSALYTVKTIGSNMDPNTYTLKKN